MRTERFFGFMKPQVTTATATGGEVRRLAPPERVTIPFGPPLASVVAVGDRVTAGQELACSPTRDAVHASIAGEVIRIGPIHTPAGRAVEGIEILGSGKDEWTEQAPMRDLPQAETEDLVDALADLGCAAPWKPAGLEDLLSPAARRPIRTVAVLAVDREPQLAVQRGMLSAEQPALASGMAVLRKLAAEARIVLVVPESERAQAAGAFAGIEVQGVGDRYPDNHWRLILADLAGCGNLGYADLREAGIVFFTAENLVRATTALEQGRPPVTKLVTVAGGAHAAPVTVETHIGAPLAHVLKELGITPAEGDRVLIGGRWQGYAQYDLQTPVTTGCDGVCVLQAGAFPVTEENVCFNCGRCVRVCPVHIPVNLVGRLVEFAFAEEAYASGARACIECGLCAYVCPALRPLQQYMRYAIDQHAQVEQEAAAAANQREVTGG